MAESLQSKEWPLRITGSYPYKGSDDKDDLVLRRAIVTEELGTLTEIQVEFMSEKTTIELDKLLGKVMTIHLAAEDGAKRKFTGTIVRVERLALRDGLVQFLAELRPWFWLLTQRTNSRIFQDMSVVEIFEKIFKEDHNISDYKKSLTNTHPKREYCVQYRETDFDFISRLMQEEGIYYYFDCSDADGKNEKLVLCDSPSAHTPITGEPKVEFRGGDDYEQRLGDFITEWAASESIRSGVVSLGDFDFEKPSASLDARSKTGTKPGHSFKEDLELYDTPGHYKETGLGNTRAKVRMTAQDALFSRRRARASVRSLETGRKFTLKDHPDKEQNGEYLITSAKYFLQTTEGYGFEKKDKDLDTGALEFPEDNSEMFMVEFEAQPAKTEFKSLCTIPWPEISGLHTAIVTGKSGEEIWTDKYGRIKVQFHWDREGKKDEKTTCWVRVVTPWSGKNWGMVHIPRIGQEVVIQFEEGDPDRPICTGMLYNAETMPPYKLPDNQTQSGIKTRSTKGGATNTFNELMFEDKKDAELVRFQAQKDHEKLVKNKSTITIGYDELDTGGNGGDGCLSQVVKQNVDETIKKGDHTFTIETGSQTIGIKTDQTETIEGKSTRTVTGNVAETVKTGNKTTTVSTGNIQVDAKSGKITMTAMQSIELKVGGSSIKLDPTSITIKSTMIKVQANAKLDAKSPMTTVNGDAMLTLKGGLTMIN
ncbi:type VI secretion system tip protein VgrG (plasmid) [Ruegeria conchae]|uniref:type VI secretion system Vgr family protein n=1 Tax=Ruegeria conchae TaxID=981384 RepID=UPI00147EF59F|nr:type VI secretion system tip protein TssI/VgrG [Ruegeria conchae]UWR05523.1 type VI secretion system tip protein VgrG [Ruegeria conchae]